MKRSLFAVLVAVLALTKPVHGALLVSWDQPIAVGGSIADVRGFQYQLGLDTLGFSTLAPTCIAPPQAPLLATCSAPMPAAQEAAYDVPGPHRFELTVSDGTITASSGPIVLTVPRPPTGLRIVG